MNALYSSVQNAMQDRKQQASQKFISAPSQTEEKSVITINKIYKNLEPIIHFYCIYLRTYLLTHSMQHNPS